MVNLFKHHWFFIGLFLLLGVVAGWRIYLVSAQPAVVTAQGGDCFDLLDYFRPASGSGPDYAVPGCSVSSGGINETNERVKVFDEAWPVTDAHSPANGFKMHKNYPSQAPSVYEWYSYDNQSIYLFEDTSWDRQCSNSQAAAYRVRDASADGLYGGKIPRFVCTGQAYSEAHYVIPVERDNTAQSCSVGGYPATASFNFSFRRVSGDDGGLGPAIPGLDTIVMELGSGAAAGEKRYYSRGYGLTGFVATDSSGKISFHSRANADGAARPELQCDSDADPFADELDADQEVGGQRDPNAFTFYPISQDFERAILQEDSQAAAKKAAEELIEEGYGVYCAVRQTTPGTELGGAVDRWLELHQGEVLDLTVNSGQSVDTAAGMLPLLRNDIITDQSTGSIENLLGLPSSAVNNEYEQKISAATVFSRMNQQQQCRFKTHYLSAIETICLNYEDVAHCQLWQPVSGADNNLKKTFNIWRESTLGCDDFGKPYEEIADKTPLDESRYRDLIDRFSEISLHMEHAKIMDFLVVSLEQPQYETGTGVPWNWNTLFGGVFNTLRFVRGITEQEEQDDPYKDKSKLPRHKVVVVAFPSPAFSFAKSQETYQYTEPQELELFSLQPQVVNDNYDALEKAQRAELLSRLKAVYNEPFNSDHLTVRPIGDVTKDTMSMAAIHVVNAKAPSCVAGFTADVADVVESSAKYEQSPSHITILGLDLHEDLFSDFSGHINDAQSFLQGLVSDVLIGENVKEVREEEKAHLNIYLLTRNRYVPEQMERIKSILYSQLMLDTIAEAEGELDAVGNPDLTATSLPGGTRVVPDYAEMDGVHLWDTQQEVYDFYDPDISCGVDEDGAEIPGPCDNTSLTAQVGVGAEQLAVPYNRHTFYNSALIGRAIYPRGTTAHNISTCSQDTEDYLLGLAVDCVLPEPAGRTPVQTGSAVEPVAQCDGGPRITSGETAVHWCVDEDAQCSNAELAAKPGVCTEYKANLHNVPNWKNSSDAFTSCEQLYSYVACTYPNSLIQNKVNAQGQFDSNGSMTACEYVVSTARAGGISPRLALAMWGEESGFSHFNTYDFGVVSQPARDLGAQLNSFIGTVKSKSSYFNFLHQYSEGYRAGDQFCANPQFPGRLKTYYDYLGP